MKDNAIQAINKATSLSEIHKQKDQYQVTINQFKPVANDLAKHKNNAISSIHQVAHQNLEVSKIVLLEHVAKTRCIK